MNKISFGSDNYAGASPEILQFLSEINTGGVHGYGEDHFTAEAIGLLREEFGSESEIFFVTSGTAANTLALGAMVKSYESIICSEVSHIYMHEVTAPQFWTGAKILPLPHTNGKITAMQIEACFQEQVFWGRHSAKPAVVSITQPTELGTLYTMAELQQIREVCKRNKLLLHLDGARIANACIAQNCSAKEIIESAGADVLAFGGSKNGLLFGEAIVFLNKELAIDFEYRQKQGLNLLSKTRFLSGQFIPYLRDKIWQRNALNANRTAKMLADGIEQIVPGSIVYAPDTNQLFVKLPKSATDILDNEFSFYVYFPEENIIRLVTSFATTEAEVNTFLKRLKELI